MEYNEDARQFLKDFDSMTDEQRENVISDLLSQNYKRFLSDGMSVEDATERFREENREIIDKYALRRRAQQMDENNHLITYRPTHMVLVDPRIVGPLFFEGKQTVETESNEITTIVSINYEDSKVSDILNNLSGSELTPFDKAVHDAICTLYVNGNAIMSIPMIYRIMNGMNSHSAPSKETRLKIKDSIIKLMRAFSNISGIVKNNAKHSKTYRQSLITGQFTTEKFSNGEVEDCLTLLAPPILYRYVRSFEDVSAVSFKLLEASVNASSGTIPLRTYLIAQIQTSVENKEEICTISLYECYRSYLRDIDLLETDIQKSYKQKIRNYIKRFLDTWKETGLITDYQMVKRDGKNLRQFSHVIIMPGKNAFQTLSSLHPSLSAKTDEF